MKTIQLVLAIHNHQPVGNLGEVFESACVTAYGPFLDVMDRYPDIPFVLHTSGALLEWMEQRRPDLVDRMAALARAGRVEIMGGGYFEPILTMLPERDRVGQVQEYTRHLRHRLGASVRGAWVAERVWEPCLVSSLADAGIEYTVVDDFHFKCAGLREGQLLGYYVSEDQGRLLRIFPGSEKLRYFIPFRNPSETVDYLASLASEAGDRVVVYADDGEKFGVWPKTHAHVYGDRWLERFLEVLRRNADWIRLRRFSDVLADTPPLGRLYLPDASYREMTEWVLPPDVLNEYEDLEKDLERLGVKDRVRPFVRGGTWRNFKAKYVEAAQMHARMIQASEAVARSRAPTPRREKARLELYRGQCNCGYWHGVFGGLYLPFLRFETYRHLLAAEALAQGRRTRPALDMDDYDLDGRPEARFATAGAQVFVKPDRGGHIYEWDDTDKRVNLMATLTRRREAYHRRLIEAAAAGQDPNKVASIHDQALVKEKGLERRLTTDPYVRESLIDHLFAPGVTLDAVAEGRAREMGDWPTAAYECRRVKTRSLRLWAEAGPARIEKALSPEGERGFLVEIALRPRAEAVGATYAVEFNIGLQAGDAEDRYFMDAAGKRLGRLRSRLDIQASDGVALVDEWLGVEFWLRPDPAAGLWAFPIETVSVSEAGFERVYQGSAVLLHWPVAGDADRAVHVEVRHR